MPTDHTFRSAGALGRGGRRLLGASALLLAGAAGAAAQGTDATGVGADPRWRAWLGCWSPVEAQGVVPADAPLTCVVPAPGGAAGVDLVRVTGGRVASRDRVAASGERHPRQTDGCDGWEQAQWSADGRRLHLRSSATCPTGVTRASSGILAFAPDGDWLEVRSASVGTGAGVRVTRYRPAPLSTALPTEVTGALAPAGRDDDARVALGAPISTDEVADAVRQSDAAVVEAWLAARGQGFTLDARRLTALADRGVPPRVIDVMVALSYPKVFALNPATGDQERRAFAASQQGRQVAQRTGPVAWLYDNPFGYGALGWNPYRYGAFGYNGYYDNGLFNNGFYGGGWFPGNNPVVIVVRDPDGTPTERPRAVNGRGYTRGGGSSGTGSPGATPRASAGSDGYRSGRSSSGESSSGSSSSGSGSSEGGGSGRTAKPRP